MVYYFTFKFAAFFDREGIADKGDKSPSVFFIQESFASSYLLKPHTLSAKNTNFTPFTNNKPSQIQAQPVFVSVAMFLGHVTHYAVLG